MSGHLLSERFFNVTIRASTLGSRLLLMVFLAHFLSPEEVGLFGLFYVTVNFGLMLSGAGFHFFSNREIVDAADTQRSKILFNQLFLYSILYILTMSTALLAFFAGLLPISLFWFFLGIMIFEHLAYEAYRLFIMLGRPLTASITSFIRGGIWVFILLLLFVSDDSLQSLETVLVVWLLGGFLALIYSVIALKRMGWNFSQVELDIDWIKNGLKVAFPFFLGVLATRIIFTLDRYFVEDLSSLGVVGAYTFYAGMCVALLGFIDAAIFSFARPKLVLAAKSSRKEKFAADMLQLSIHTLLTTVVIGLAIYFLSFPLMQAIENPIYFEHLDLFSFLLIAFSLYILSEVPRLGLYATKSDRMILYGDFVALFTFLAGFASLQMHLSGALSVPMAMIFAFISRLLVLCYYFSTQESDLLNR